MDFRLSDEELLWRKQVIELIEREKTPELFRESVIEYTFGPHSWEFLRKLGERGWLAPALPKEYGGIGASPLQRFILLEELSYRVGYTPPVGVSIVGPTLLSYGSQEQKSEYLPPIARGEIEFALGYTEPEAGSDLASLQMRAVPMDDHYVISGQKVFNTRCHFAQYHWLGARTDPTVAKHRGISLFIVDLKSPGITINPLITMSGWRTNAVYYDEVKVPRSNLVGEENKGWYYMRIALEHERTITTGNARWTFERLVEHVKQGHPVNPVLQHKLAEAAIELEVASLLGLRVSWRQSRGTPTPYEASEVKVFVSELEQRIIYLGMEILGLYGALRADSKRAPLDGIMEFLYRGIPQLTLVRGTSEVQRNIIALRGLGLPPD